MRVILYMAVSINGMIAKSDDDTGWISKKEWGSYSLAVRTAGCLIIGRRTYDILTKQPEFAEFKDIKIVVVSHENILLLSHNHLVADSPKEALKLLVDFGRVVVAGGGILNASFMSENLVDEIYLDIEPIIISDGIPVFKGGNFQSDLKLLDQKYISKNEVQLHYEVVR